MTTTLHYWPAVQRHAVDLATALDVPCSAIALHRFPDQEFRISVDAPGVTALVYMPLDQPNEKLVALALAAEALRRNGARRLVLVAPYLCYMRQDAAFAPGEAISQRAIGRMLAADWDRIVTVDAHLHRVSSLSEIFVGRVATNLQGTTAIAAGLAGAVAKDAVLCGPDSESRQWVGELAAQLDRPFVVGAKQRQGDRDVAIHFERPDEFRGRPVIVVDDIASSGGTLAACATALLRGGASSVDVVVTHALFDADAAELLTRTGIRSVRSTTSTTHDTANISLTALLADALRDELNAEFRR